MKGKSRSSTMALAGAASLSVLLLACGQDRQGGERGGGEAVREEWAAVAGELSGWDARLGRGPDAGKLLDVFQRKAGDHDLVVRMVSPGSVVAGKAISHQPYEIAVSGPTRGVWKYLLDLHEMPRLAVPQRLRLSWTEEGLGGTRAEFDLLVFFWSEAGGAPAGTPGSAEALSEARMKLAALKKRQRASSSAADILRALAEETPEGLWLDRIEQREEGYRVSGAALDLRPVTHLYDRLVERPDTGPVRLGDIEKRFSLRQEEYYAFQLFVALKAEAREGDAPFRMSRDPFIPLLGPRPADGQPVPPGAGLRRHASDDCDLIIVARWQDESVAWFQTPDGRTHRARVGERFADGKVVAVSYDDREVVVRMDNSGDVPVERIIRERGAGEAAGGPSEE